MKEKAIIFLVGLLLGAVISTASIYVYTVANNSNGMDMKMQMPNEDRGQGGMMENGGNTPPEIPDGNQNTN